MIVDDEGFNREVMAVICKNGGHTVDFAEHGAEALDKLGQARFDLVLLDFMMPVMDGPALLQAMQAHETHRIIPVVIMSSLPEPAAAEPITGMYAAFLRKPFKLRAMLEVVESIVNGGR